MEANHPIIRLIVYGKLKRMIRSYVGKKVKSVDKNLLRGIFKRKLKDFDEDFRDNLGRTTLFDRLKGDAFYSNNNS